MQQPHYITSKRLEDILEQQYGLYHRANRTHIWDVSDLLKQQYDLDILYRIYEEGPISNASLYATPYIPIVGAKVKHHIHDYPSLRIPEENFSGCTSWYITDTAQWILWIQSAQDFSKVWAWLMDINGLRGITAFNDEISKGGWHLMPSDALRQHIRDWEAVCEQAHQAHESWQRARQHPTTPDCAFELQLLPDAMPMPACNHSKLNCKAAMLRINASKK